MSDTWSALVTHAIPEIGAEPGDVLVEVDGDLLVSKCHGPDALALVSNYRHHFHVLFGCEQLPTSPLRPYLKLMH